MGRKKSRSKQEYSYTESNEENSNQEDFAASLLASMDVNDKPISSETVPETAVEEVDEGKEDFEVRHPHLSSIKSGIKKVFGRDSTSDAESDAQSKISKSEDDKSVASETESTKTESVKTVKEPAETPTEGSTDQNPPRRRNRRKEKLAEREKERVRLIQEATEEASTEEDKRLIELKGMGMMIHKAGLVEHEVQPDGHCLFHSLSDQLEVRHGISTDAQALRSTLAKYIRENPDDFTPYMLDEETGELKDITEYTNELETTALWGGDLEILAASEVYKVPISIHFASQLPLSINDTKFKSEPLHLAFYQAKYGLGAHYNSLRDMTEDQKSSADLD